MAGLDIRSEESEKGIVCFELRGSIDAATFRDLEDAFQRELARNIHRFLLDVHDVDYLSSAGAGVLIGAAQTCEEKGGKVVLVRPTRELEDLFQLLGVYRLFLIVETRKEAVEFLQSV
jgi:anti-sigma B factor antagonist